MKTNLLLIILAFSIILSCTNSRDSKNKNSSESNDEYAKELQKNRINDSIFFRKVQQDLFKTIQEPNLNERKIESYRFWWDRAFHDRMLFRIEKENQNYFLTVKTYDQHSPTGTGKDTLISTFRKKIEESEWNDFIGHLQKADFWRMDIGKNEGQGYYDGSYWRIEGYLPDHGKQRTVRRFSPDSGEFKEACLKLINLYGDIPEEEIY